MPTTPHNGGAGRVVFKPDNLSGVHMRLRPPPSAPLPAERQPSCWRLSALPLQWPDCALCAPHAGEPQAFQGHQFGCGLPASGALSRSPPFQRADPALAFSAIDALPRAARNMPFSMTVEAPLSAISRLAKVRRGTESRHEAESKRFLRQRGCFARSPVAMTPTRPTGRRCRATELGRHGQSPLPHRDG